MITSTDRRGAEVFALDLDELLARRGHTTRTVALAPGPIGGLSVALLGKRPLALSTLRHLRREARHSSVVVAHGSTTLPACAIALVGTGVPFVYRNIGDPTYWTGSWIRRARVRRFLRRAAAVVAVADRAADEMVRRFGMSLEKITVIPTGVAAERHSPASAEDRERARVRFALPADAFVVALVAALVSEKDVPLAIEAVSAIPHARLLIAGDGPERAAFERLAERRAPGRVQFAGALDDAGPAYAAADVVLLTSRSEGLPAVLIEAGLRGLPSVATDVGYVREVVIDGETGVVVPNRDRDQLAGALQRAKEAAPALGRAARDHCVARFELEGVGSRWEAVLGALETGRTRRRRSSSALG